MPNQSWNFSSCHQPPASNYINQRKESIVCCLQVPSTGDSDNFISQSSLFQFFVISTSNLHVSSNKSPPFAVNLSVADDKTIVFRLVEAL